jgi:hypothetical protein
MYFVIVAAYGNVDASDDLSRRAGRLPPPLTRAMRPAIHCPAAPPRGVPGKSGA